MLPETYTKIYDVLISFGLLCAAITTIKTIFIGGDYSIFYRFKYGDKYINWYHQRETFIEYLKRN